MRNQSAWNIALQGATAGLLATLPMTAAMLMGLKRWARRSESIPPPREIISTAARRLNLDNELAKRAKIPLSWGAHFAYGAGVGVVYRAIEGKVSAPPLVKGSLYGLMVWAGSYPGWLRVVRFPMAAQKESAGKNGAMILAHVVWGAALGLIVAHQGRRSGRPLSMRRHGNAKFNENSPGGVRRGGGSIFRRTRALATKSARHL